MNNNVSLNLGDFFNSIDIILFKAKRQLVLPFIFKLVGCFRIQFETGFLFKLPSKKNPGQEIFGEQGKWGKDPWANLTHCNGRHELTPEAESTFHTHTVTSIQKSHSQTENELRDLVCGVSARMRAAPRQGLGHGVGGALRPRSAILGNLRRGRRRDSNLGSLSKRPTGTLNTYLATRQPIHLVQAAMRATSSTKCY